MLYNHFIEKEVKQSNNSIHAYGEKYIFVLNV